MSTSKTVNQPLYPTTGEPVAVNARRNRVGLWLCIVSDVTGTVALLIAYSYLWSLNVNNKWAPPNDAWAADWLFWTIVAGAVIATVLMWGAYRRLIAGNRGAYLGLATVASIVVLVTFALQIYQVSTFPFDIQDGAYASATFWLGFGALYHLSIVLFLVPAMVLRARAGRITPDNASHPRLVATWMTWVCVALALGAIFTSTMKASPNTLSPPFGTFVNE